MRSGVKGIHPLLLSCVQERLYDDNALLKAALDLVASVRPGYLPKDMLQRVSELGHASEGEAAPLVRTRLPAPYHTPAPRLPPHAYRYGPRSKDML